MFKTPKSRKIRRNKYLVHVESPAKKYIYRKSRTLGKSGKHRQAPANAGHPAYVENPAKIRRKIRHTFGNTTKNVENPANDEGPVHAVTEAPPAAFKERPVKNLSLVLVSVTLPDHTTRSCHPTNERGRGTGASKRQGGRAGGKREVGSRGLDQHPGGKWHKKIGISSKSHSFRRSVDSR